jgi:hypothetical protein
MSGVPVKGWVTTGGDGGLASFEHEKKNTSNAIIICLNQAFLNELE